MKVIMNQTIKGSNDGRNEVTFMKGNEYEVLSEISLYLSDAWIKRGICIEKKEKVKPKTEEKAILNYENKMLSTKIENKAITNVDNKSNLEDLSIEELKQILNDKNIKFHPNIGKKKLINKIKENK